MNGMTAITFALPEESRGLAGLLRHGARTGCCGARLGNLGPREVLLFHTGMGEARVRERLGRFLWEHRVARLISAGYAGGLDPALHAGALLLGANRSAPGLLAAAEALLQGQARTVMLATVGRALETAAAKARLARETGAHAVDMESAAIAALCREAGVPMLSLRVISDPAGEELAVPFSVCFDAARECPRPFTLGAFLLRHPSRLPGFLRFAAEVARARAALTAAVAALAAGLPEQPG